MYQNEIEQYSGFAWDRLPKGLCSQGLISGLVIGIMSIRFGNRRAKYTAEAVVLLPSWKIDFPET
jgi:uncharacterized membrane-anchored protein YhcB (DUF1043 family)